MRISDIFRGGSSIATDRSEESERTRRLGSDSNTQETENAYSGEDTVTISSMSRQLSQISKIMSEDEVTSQQKVASLREQIETQSYDVSSADIAGSMLGYFSKQD